MATINVDFPDAHMAALLVGESVAELYSLDSDFDRIPGITRLEP
jgi:predicted nucleic acid-binding protein